MISHDNKLNYQTLSNDFSLQTLTNAKMEVICVKKMQLVITPLVGTTALVTLVMMEMERTALVGLGKI